MNNTEYISLGKGDIVTIVKDPLTDSIYNGRGTMSLDGYSGVLLNNPNAIGEVAVSVDLYTHTSSHVINIHCLKLKKKYIKKEQFFIKDTKKFVFIYHTIDDESFIISRYDKNKHPNASKAAKNELAWLKNNFDEDE